MLQLKKAFYWWIEFKYFDVGWALLFSVLAANVFFVAHVVVGPPDKTLGYWVGFWLIDLVLGTLGFMVVYLFCSVALTVPVTGLAMIHSIIENSRTSLSKTFLWVAVVSNLAAFIVSLNLPAFIGLLVYLDFLVATLFFIGAKLYPKDFSKGTYFWGMVSFAFGFSVYFFAPLDTAALFSTLAMLPLQIRMVFLFFRLYKKSKLLPLADQKPLLLHS